MIQPEAIRAAKVILGNAYTSANGKVGRTKLAHAYHYINAPFAPYHN